MEKFYLKFWIFGALLVQCEFFSFPYCDVAYQFQLVSWINWAELVIEGTMLQVGGPKLTERVQLEGFLFFFGFWWWWGNL